jgi:hypothetical protein
MVFSKIDQELQSLVVYLSRDVIHKSDQQSRLINILSQHTVQLKIVHGDERHIHYIEQDIYENTHIQQLMLKVHKIEIFFGFDFEICIISLLVVADEPSQH